MYVNSTVRLRYKRNCRNYPTVRIAPPYLTVFANISECVDLYMALYFPSFVLHHEEGCKIVADISAVDLDKHFNYRTSEFIYVDCWT